jgi:flagellin
MVGAISPGIRNLNQATLGLNKLNEKLGSGKRINRASDDAAGLSIANSLVATTRISSQARRNISDANSRVEIADGALSQLSDIGSRLSELAAQSANGTINDQQRVALQGEFQALAAEAERIVATTSFNGENVLTSSGISIQAGIDASSNSQIEIGSSEARTLAESLNSSYNVSSQESAKTALEGLSSFISSVSSERGALGAVTNRLKTASSNLSTAEEAQNAARSRIEDFDVAMGIAERAALNIRQQAGVAITAQGNQSQKTVLQLLQ